MTKTKIFNLVLIITSLFVYLEWGTDNSMFLIEGEIDVLSKLFTNPSSVIHPLTVLPLIGQILLLITLFQKQPKKLLSYLGIGGISLLVLLICFVGAISLNFKIIFSTIPYIFTAFLAIRHLRKKTIET